MCSRPYRCYRCIGWHRTAPAPSIGLPPEMEESMEKVSLVSVESMAVCSKPYRTGPAPSIGLPPDMEEKNGKVKLVSVESMGCV